MRMQNARKFRKEFDGKSMWKKVGWLVLWLWRFVWPVFLVALRSVRGSLDGGRIGACAIDLQSKSISIPYA